MIFEALTNFLGIEVPALQQRSTVPQLMAAALWARNHNLNNFYFIKKTPVPILGTIAEK